MKSASLFLWIVILLVGLVSSSYARANEVLWPRPPNSPGDAYLENRTTTPGGLVRVTLIPYLSTIWYGTVDLRLNEGVLEIRMRYRDCSDYPICPVQPNLTQDFRAPEMTGIYGVRIYHVITDDSSNPGVVVDYAMLMGTDVLTVRDPAEPIPTLETWSRIALVLLLVGLAVPFVGRSR